MASSLVKIDIHIIFHVKNNGRNMRSEDLPRIFQYIGGVIRGLNVIPIEIGGGQTTYTFSHHCQKPCH